MDACEDAGAGPWALLLGAVLAVRCAGCGRPDVRLCLPCAAVLGTGAQLVPVAALPPGAGCPVAASTAYAGPVRHLLAAWKEHGRADLLAALGAALAEAVALAVLAGPAPEAAGGAAGGLVLVPAPSSPRAVRARGQDVVAALARSAAAQLSARGVPARARAVLAPTRRVADQALLAAPDRARNLARAHRVRPGSDVRGWVCVVVDDVLTTGATAAECRRALVAAGALVVAVAAVAATPRRAGAPG